MLLEVLSIALQLTVNGVNMSSLYAHPEVDFDLRFRLPQYLDG